MECPDIYKLLDFVEDEASAPDVYSHVQNCASCRAQLRLIRELPAAYRPEFEVPEVLVQRVMNAVVRQAQPEAGEETVHPLQLFASGLLGTMTALVVVVATGSIGEGTTPVELMLFSVLVGVASTWVLSSERFARRPGEV